MVLAVSGLCKRRSLLTRCVDAPGTSEWYVKESSRLSDQNASGRGTMLSAQPFSRTFRARSWKDGADGSKA